MVDTATVIMVEVLKFSGIVTKEIKQGRTSKRFLYKKFALTKSFAEKYLKKLMGKNHIEDALKRLERLTQEEARMAAAQLLKVTNATDNRVGGIAANVLVVENRVAGIDDRVAGVDECVAGVDERVAGVNDRAACVDNRVAGIGDQVQGVDDKVTAVMNGARYIFYLLS
jgi:hypothetical protein